MFLEIISIYVSLILALPTDRILITIVTQPHLNPHGVGGGGGGWGTSYDGLTRYFHIS